jgi:hypothetical protein
LVVLVVVVVVMTEANGMQTGLPSSQNVNFQHIVSDQSIVTCMGDTRD